MAQVSGVHVHGCGLPAVGDFLGLDHEKPIGFLHALAKFFQRAQSHLLSTALIALLHPVFPPRSEVLLQRRWSAFAFHDINPAFTDL